MFLRRKLNISIYTALAAALTLLATDVLGGNLAGKIPDFLETINLPN